MNGKLELELALWWGGVLPLGRCALEEEPVAVACVRYGATR